VDRAITRQDKTDEADGPEPRRSSVGWSFMTSLARLLARQAARELLKHAGSDGAPSEFVDKDRT